MINLELQPIANQTFSIVLDGFSYDITIESCPGITTASITRDSGVLISNVQCVAGSPLLVYPYIQDGNFVFLTQNDELPYYEKFGVTQSLVYASRAEIEAIVNGE